MRHRGGEVGKAKDVAERMVLAQAGCAEDGDA